MCVYCVYCVYGVCEVLFCYTNNSTVKINQSATTLRVYTDLEGSLPSRMGWEVISYGLSECGIWYICLGLAVSTLASLWGNRPRCDSAVGLAVSLLVLGDLRG